MISTITNILHLNKCMFHKNNIRQVQKLLQVDTASIFVLILYSYATFCWILLHLRHRSSHRKRTKSTADLI